MLRTIRHGFQTAVLTVITSLTPGCASETSSTTPDQDSIPGAQRAVDLRVVPLDSGEPTRLSFEGTLTDAEGLIAAIDAELAPGADDIVGAWLVVRVEGEEFMALPVATEMMRSSDDAPTELEAILGGVADAFGLELATASVTLRKLARNAANTGVPPIVRFCQPDYSYCTCRGWAECKDMMDGACEAGTIACTFPGPSFCVCMPDTVDPGDPVALELAPTPGMLSFQP